MTVTEIVGHAFCRWPLDNGDYRMYYNKQYERWALFFKNKYVKGSIRRLDQHGGHKGQAQSLDLRTTQVFDINKLKSPVQTHARCIQSGGNNTRTRLYKDKLICMHAGCTTPDLPLLWLRLAPCTGAIEGVYAAYIDHQRWVDWDKMTCGMTAMKICRMDQGPKVSNSTFEDGPFPMDQFKFFTLKIQR